MDELAGLEAHHLLPLAALDPVILPAEGHGIRVGADKAMVRDGDAMGVSTPSGLAAM